MNHSDLEHISSVLIGSACAAGNVLMQLFGSPLLTIRSKSDNSPLTDADLQSQALIMKDLATHFPNIPIASEELTHQENSSAMGDCFFIVDPLDSTKNFATGIPFFDVSIAFVKDGLPWVGVVRDPVHDVTYSAI